MTIKHFPIYKETILKSIDSCITKEQLQCCWDMRERFADLFKYILPHPNVKQAVNEIEIAYENKEAKLEITF